MFTGKYQPRRLFRLHWNRKYKYKDRWHGKSWKFIPRWYVRRIEPDWTFNRRKSAPETGYGVAYEKNPDSEMY